MHYIKRIKTSSPGIALGAAAALSLLVSVAWAAPDPYTTVQPVDDVADFLPAGTVTHKLTRLQAGEQRLTVVSGVLSPASSSAPETIGDHYIAMAPDVLGKAAPEGFRLEDTVQFHMGYGLRYEQTHKGLPVIGGTTVVRLDDAGRVRWAASSARQIPADLDVQPTLTAREAVIKATDLAGYDRQYVESLVLENSARLVIFSQPVMDEPRLAYQVELPQDLRRMAVWRAFVDAHTGHVYKLENRVANGNLPTCAAGTKRAYVYPQNPIDTPDLVCESLAPWIAPGENGLRNADIETGNCVDDNSCFDTNLGVAIHWCNDAPLAFTNANDDFTDHQFTSDTDPQDTFAEVQMFYHVNKALDHARAMGGFTNLPTRPMQAVVNFHLPIDIATGDLLGAVTQLCLFGPPYTGTDPLYPFDNAAFVPAGGLFGYPENDGMVFGQGSTADFASDGDVVYHEFGHALMNAVAPGLGFGFFDQYGFDSTPGGMHEGYADLNTLWVTDDPEVGEYTGMGLGLNGPIRNLDNTNACPAQLRGEVHEDALPITGAIYEARQTIVANGGDKDAFDIAVWNAQQLFTDTDNYETAAAKTIAEVEASMGAAHAGTLTDILAARGISDCQSRIADGSVTKDLLFVGYANVQTAGWFPGPIQSEITLSDPADEIPVDMELVRLVAASGLGGSTLSVGIKSGSPVQWTDTANGLTADFDTTAAVAIDEASEVGSATLIGPFPAGTYYVQFYSEGGGYVMRNASIDYPRVGGAPDAGPGGGPDAGGPGGPDAGPGNPGDGDGGCGCVVGERQKTPVGGILLAFLGVLALTTSVRRRHYQFRDTLGRPGHARHR